MRQVSWTLLVLGCLGGIAAAQSEPEMVVTEGGAIDHSHRGVANDYLVLPSGGELTAQMRFLTADAVLGSEKLRFTDLALFGLSGRWSLFTRLELAAAVELLPKQPSYTDEKPWQSVGLTMRIHMPP